MAYVTAPQLQEALLAWLKARDMAELPAAAADYVPRAVRYARLEALKAWLPQGYTAAQIESSQQAEEFTTLHGLYYCAIHAANLEASDVWVEKLLFLANRIVEGGLTVEDELVDPDDADTDEGAVSAGRLAVAEWAFADGAGGYCPMCCGAGCTQCSSCST